MPLRAKFWLAFACLAVLVGALAVCLASLANDRDLIVRLTTQPLMGVSHARRANTTMVEALRLMDGVVRNGSPSVDDLASLDALKRDIDADLEVVRTRLHGRRISEALVKASNAITEWFREGRLLAAPDSFGETTLPLPTGVESDGRAAIAALDDVVELVAADGFSFRLEAQETLRRSSATLAALGGTVVAISALFVVMLARGLIRPILAATHVAEHIAADRPCTIGPSKRRDEVGRLLNCLATMQRNLAAREVGMRTLVSQKQKAARFPGDNQQAFRRRAEQYVAGAVDVRPGRPPRRFEPPALRRFTVLLAKCDRQR